MRIEFGAVKLGAIARAHLAEVLNNNHITAGTKVAAFEREWGQLFSYAHSKAVSSGTDACMNICFSLYDFGAKRGDEIITPALSFIATANAIMAAGFVPKFVDIKRETLNIDPAKIEAAITDKTQAIQVVHTMGRPCEMDEIMAIADKHGLPVLEDCCEAHGAQYRGRFIGTFGHAAAFSFYAAHLICSAEGGMVSTMHQKVADVINSTRSHGRRNGELFFDFPRRGLNSKMNDLEASIALEGIESFWTTFNTRHRTMSVVREALRGKSDHAWFSEEDASNVNCPHGFSITMREPAHAAALKSWLTDKSVHWKRNFGSIPTQHGAFADLGYALGEFPEAEYVGDNGLHFGIHQHLSASDIEYLCETLRDFPLWR